MVGAMALLSSLSMPTGVVEESCIRQHPSPSDSPPVASIIASSHPKRQQRRSLGDRRRRHLALRPTRNHLSDDEDDDEEDEADGEDDAVMDERRQAPQPAQPAPAQDNQQLYSLRWHDFQSSILSSFRHLRDVEDFVDVTLACDGKSFTAHKMVLSACSPYFRHLLKANPCQHPIVILRDVKYRDMEALLRFMYNGEVSVSNEQLPSVLHTARMLQVKGLADVPSKHYPNKRVSDYSNETPSSRESSTERRLPNPPRKRARSRSSSPMIGNVASVAAVVSSTDAGRTEAPQVAAENGRRNEDDDEDDDENGVEEEDSEGKALSEEKQQQLLLDAHRESLLSQALEGRSSQSLMAHLLATRRSGNQSETSSRSEHGGGGMRSGHHVEDDDASDSDDTDASDRDRTDVGDLSNTEDNVYPSQGLMGDLHRSSMHGEMMPPSGFGAHHPLLNLQSLHSLFPGSMPNSNGPSGGGQMHGRHHHDSHNNNNDLAARRSLDLMRIRATDPRPCPQCGKIYRSAHTLRTHLEDKHTVCPGYRCVLCGTVAKSRNSLHSHMSRQHRGISTKDLPVVPMPAPFDPVLASCLLAKAGVKVSPAELAARASPTSGNPRGRTADLRLDFKSPHSGSMTPGTLPPQVTIGGLQSHRNNPMLIALEDPEDLSQAQHRLRGESGRDHHHHHRDKNSGHGGQMAYGSAAAAAGLVNRLGLSTKMGKHWLESNMAAMQQQQQQQQSPGSNQAGGGSTGSALLDTYLQLIAEHSSNMAAAAAAAAAAQNTAGSQPNNNNHPSDDHDSANLLDGCEKRSPKATAGD